MAYALFCQETKISKAYPTEGEVWGHAADSGLVVDLPSSEEAPEPKQMLANDYEIKSCPPDTEETEIRHPGHAA